MCEHKFIYGGVKYEIENQQVLHYFDWFFCEKCLDNKYKKLNAETGIRDPLLFDATAKPLIDFQKLEQVFTLCQICGVGFSLTYQESSEQWYFVVTSPAPAECLVGKSTTFDIAVADVLQWLRQIAP